MIKVTEIVGRVPQVDVASLTDDEIRRGVIQQGQALGSFGYFVTDEIARCLTRKNTVAFLSYGDTEEKQLRVYYDAGKERR